MKNLKVLMLSLLTMLLFVFAAPKALQYKVDPSQTKVKWIGQKVTGEHYGSVNITAGFLSVEEGVITGGTFSLDMTSIVVEDLGGMMKKKLEKHLKSEDFFGVEAHPTAKFVITKVYRQGKEKNEYKVVGNLTIKGITKELKFPAVVEVDKESLKAKATITVDRTEFNVRYGSGSFFDDLGNKTIYDEFILEVELSAKVSA
ncbi:YceI family protein [Persicobacter sp. CCB-QB2]|uniref:YceI family protein n=1 Tax=Persicobacter sp. CCB-QB2 TaxID=1561025 RepID=UPI0009E497E3|nr:YceI family protein [Persicobacter sp. CCB-QB2]